MRECAAVNCKQTSTQFTGFGQISGSVHREARCQLLCYDETGSLRTDVGRLVATKTGHRRRSLWVQSNEPRKLRFRFRSRGSSGEGSANAGTLGRKKNLG